MEPRKAAITVSHTGIKGSRPLSASRVADHHGFDGKRSVLGQQQLIIRFAVFSGVKNASFPHGRPGVFHVPAVLLCTGKADGVQPVQRVKQAHGRGGGQIDVCNGLIERGDRFIQSGRRFGALRHGQKAAAVPQRDQLVAAFVVIHGELLREIELHAVCHMEPGKTRRTRPLCAAGKRCDQ